MKFDSILVVVTKAYGINFNLMRFFGFL